MSKTIKCNKCGNFIDEHLKDDCPVCRKDNVVEEVSNDNNGTKLCPYCSEEIKAQAKKCKHCGEFLDKELKNNRNTQTETKVVVEQKRGGLMTTLIVLAILGLLLAIFGI